MKTPILLALALATVSVHGQSMEELMKRAMEQSQQHGGAPGGMTVEENTDPFVPLGFTGSFRMEVHNYKNGAEEKDSPMNIAMAFTDEKMAMAPETPGKEKGSMKMVMDLKNKFTYTLITDEKGQRTGMKMKMMKVNMDDGADKETKDEGQVVRTDETRTIEGHLCRKYTYTGKDGSGEAWLAEDLEFNAFKAMGSMASGKKPERWQQAPYQGMMMETTWNDTNGKDKVVMFTKDLVVGKENKEAFSMDGYQIQDMSNMPMFGR
jgi:hypothetical protein